MYNTLFIFQSMIVIRASGEDDELAIRRVHETALTAQEGPTIADLAIALGHDPTAQPVTSPEACKGQQPVCIAHKMATQSTRWSPASRPVHGMGPDLPNKDTTRWNKLNSGRLE
jgi:hypothetical protein